MDAQPNNGKLFARIAAVMAAVRNMPKDGVNTQSNFNYFSSDGILDRIGKEMAAHGLVIIPTLTEYDSVDEPTASGKTRTRTRASFQMDICDVDGNAYSARWAGEGTDYGNPDRALNKAMTNATKYFLLKLFVVGQGGDADDDEASEAQARKPQPQAKAQTPTRPQPAQPIPAQVTPARPKASEAQLTKLHTVGGQAYGDAWEEQRHKLVAAVSKGAITSSTDLTPNEASELIDGIERKLAAQAKAKFDAPTPAERGATGNGSGGAAGRRMAQRMQA